VQRPASTRPRALLPDHAAGRPLLGRGRRVQLLDWAVHIRMGAGLVSCPTNFQTDHDLGRLKSGHSFELDSNVEDGDAGKTAISTGETCRAVLNAASVVESRPRAKRCLYDVPSVIFQRRRQEQYCSCLSFRKGVADQHYDSS
jgi:hypothetical protein